MRGGNSKFEFAVLVNKRKLKRAFKVIHVSVEPPSVRPAPDKCHHYDVASRRRGTLSPFDFCDVVRVEIPRGEFRSEPVAGIARYAVMAVLVKNHEVELVRTLLRAKRMSHVQVLCLRYCRL